MYTPSTTQSFQARQFQQQVPQFMQQLQQPQAQGNNPIPEQLQDLIVNARAAKIISDTVQAARAENDMAAGGPQPTVAEGIKSKLQQAGLEAAQQQMAMSGSGHADTRAKAQGLAAIADQGQKIPNAAQGPQPMQRMAAGGLARLPSNLPQNYAGGGIIAFAEAGKVPDAVSQIPTGDDNTVPAEESVGSSMSYGEQMKNLLNAFPNAIYSIAKGGADMTADAYKVAKAIAPDVVKSLTSAPGAHNPLIGGAPDVTEQLAAELAKRPPAPSVMDKYRAEPPAASTPSAQLSPDAVYTERVRVIQAELDKAKAAVQANPNDARAVADAQALQRELQKLASTPQYQTHDSRDTAGTKPEGLIAADAANGAARPRITPADLTAYEKTSPVQDPVEQSVIRSVSQDADTVASQRAKAKQEILRASQDAANQTRLSGIAGLQAAQEAQAAARQEGKKIFGLDAATLRAMADPSRAHAGANWGVGVAQDVMDKTAGYRAQDTQNQILLQTLKQAQVDALLMNDVNKANDIDAQRKEVEANIRSGQTSGASIITANEARNARVEGTVGRVLGAQDKLAEDQAFKHQQLVAKIQNEASAEVDKRIADNEVLKIQAGKDPSIRIRMLTEEINSRMIQAGLPPLKESQTAATGKTLSFQTGKPV